MDEKNVGEPVVVNAESASTSNFQATPVTSSDETQVSWTASEFIEHAKSIDWYLALGVVTVLVTGLLYFLSRDLYASGAVLISALALGYYAGRKPRQLQYHLDKEGLTIAEKHFPYRQFRSFTIMDEDAFASIVFMPLKRFGLPTTIYFAPEDEDRIVDIINQHLPFEPRDRDAIDRLMKRIRF
jgi:hypothetical protein